MHRRYSILPVLLLLSLALAATASHAAKMTPSVEPLVGAPQRIIAATPQNVNTVCTLGVTDSPAWIVNYILPPDDKYLTLLDPTACGCTEPGGVLLSNAHILLNFPVACSVPISIAVVPADLADPACPVPVAGAYLCAPVAYNVSVPAAGNYDVVLPMAVGCCITQKAFLEVTFLTAGTCNTMVRLITSAICNSCWSYNIYPGNMDDLCVAIGFPGNPVMYVDGACCDAVPAMRGTWGRLKTLYR